MKACFTSIIFLCGFGLAGKVFANPTCSVSQAKKIYRLELSVPAAFCREVTSSDPSCKAFPKASIIQLHGLWPNYESGYPAGECAPNICKKNDSKRYCDYPEPEGLYAAPIWKTHQEFMAGVEICLERHEWVKHGTCSPMSPVEYFAWSLAKTREIATALNVKANTSISRSNFARQVKTRLPELDGAIHIICKNKYVSSLYVLYEWGNKPGSPIKTKTTGVSFKGCNNNVIFLNDKNISWANK